MKLVLDELYSPQIAERLRKRDHDVVAVKERPDLERLSYEELFARMPPERRAILTENWADYNRLIRRAAEEDTPHYGVLFTSRQQLPRSRHTICLYVRVLHDFLQRHPADDAILNSSRWLPDRPL